MSALVVYERMNELQTASQALFASGFFTDVKSQAQAMVKVMAGAELGLPPFAAMTGINIIQGKPTLGANAIATLVKNSGRYDYRIKRADNEACVLTWYENGQPVGEAGFTIQEANAAGLTGKATWKSYTSDMLFARAISRGARRFAPGIFGGAPIYTPDEMGVDTDEDGYIVQGEVIEPEPAKQQPEPAHKSKPMNLADRQPSPLADSQYQYEDGEFVATAAVATYLEYVAAHDGKAPANVHNLRAWFKKVHTPPQPEPEPAAEQGDLIQIAPQDPA